MRGLLAGNVPVTSMRPTGAALFRRSTHMCDVPEERQPRIQCVLQGQALRLSHYMGWFAEQGFAPAIDWKALPRKSQPALEGTPVRSTCPRQHRHRRSCADHGIWRWESGTDPAVRNQQGYRLAMSRQALWGSD